MERVKLNVRVREGRGSKDAKAMRAAGDIPGVVYSATSETQAIAVSVRDLRQAVSAHGLHTILDVSIDGDGMKARPALIKDLQLDPVRDRVVHIDDLESTVLATIAAPVSEEELKTEAELEAEAEAEAAAALEAELSAEAGEEGAAEGGEPAEEPEGEGESGE